MINDCHNHKTRMGTTLCKLRQIIYYIMHFIEIRNLRATLKPHQHDVQNQVNAWYATVKSAEWKNLEEVRKIYRDAEAVGNFMVFNIKGNSYHFCVSRVVTELMFC